VGDEVMLLSSPDGVRFPNAILARGWERLVPGDDVVIGSGEVLGAAIELRVVRWWDPRPTPIDAGRTDVLGRVSQMEMSVSPSPCLPLFSALASGAPGAVTDRTRAMLGAGRGLTPEGDDRLIGAFAAFRHIALSVGHPAAGGMLDEVADDILAMATRRTASLSVTLLRHSLAGEVPDPVADLLHALMGRGGLSSALDRCLVVGGSSGQALAEGVLCGARAACEVSS
jgi:hypothetical protein